MGAVDVPPLITSSGAGIAPLSVDLAQVFCQRQGIHDCRVNADDLGWAAYEDSTKLIGVAVLGELKPPRGRAWIAVAPERRRLGIGAELVASVARTARDLGLQYLTCGHSTGDAAPDRFIKSLGLPVARRVEGGVAWTVTILSGIDTGEK